MLTTQEKEIKRLKKLVTELREKDHEKDKLIYRLYSTIRVLKVKIRSIQHPEEMVAYNVPEKAYTALCNMFMVDISIKSREMPFVKGRQFYYKYLRDNTRLSLKEMSKTLDLHQDHSTVIHALREFDDKIDIEKDYAKEYQKFCEKMKEIALSENKGIFVEEPLSI